MTYDTPRSGTATMTAPTSAGLGLMRLREIEGRDIIGLNDEHIGTVNDVLIDYDEHTVRYCTVDVGGFLGMGARTVLIPFEKLQWSGDALYLPVEREVLENAPEFDPTAGHDRIYEESVTTAWGIPTYWTAPTYGVDHSHWREEQDVSPEMRHDRRSL